MDYLVLVNEYIENFMMIPGRIENYVIIVDCKNLGMFNMPYKMIQAILYFLQSQYKCKTKVVYCLNCPMTFSAAWKVIKQFLDTNTAKKVQIESTNTSKELLDMVFEEQLEKKFGGKAPDVTDKFWPPRMPSNNFGNLSDDRFEGLAPKTKKTKHSVKEVKTKNKFANLEAPKMEKIEEEEEE